MLKTDRFLRTALIFIIDSIISILASAGTLSLVFLLLPQAPLDTQTDLVWLGSSLIATIISILSFHTYKDIIRYSTLRETGRLSVTVLGKEILLWLGVITFTSFRIGSGLLYGMLLIDFFITLCALTLVRVSMVVTYDMIESGNSKRQIGVKRVLVYGTSDKSVSARQRLRKSPHYSIAGFINPGKASNSHYLVGLPVHYFDSAEGVGNIAKTEEIDGVLFPYVADAREEQYRLVEFCRGLNLRTYVIPGIDEMTDGKALGNYVGKIRIEDLLGRDEIKISMNEIIDNFSNKVVMVTGAAGSIGSELCRQLATFGVKRLILFDNAETPLHNIRLELEDRFPQLDFIPVIGDVRSINRLDFVFRNYQPQIVFHAAAYKHVPLMEENPCEAVKVNVVGSRQVADKCVEYGIDKMIMVSTDKAVNPTNIMGCTKRLAEIYVQSLGLAIERGEKKGKTTFVTTRFGNVLGSNGSVIPRFREQIEHGGPVTVTHPEITRFFMTIPEACRLVMEAATFASGTQIFVFDMGESVRIVTLAERMIHLAGLEVGKDIKIEFTGLRPGEKLYEEVLATKENTIPTSHDRIFVAKAREYPHSDAIEVAEELDRLSTEVSIPEMVKLMKHTVLEFKSNNSEYEKYDRE